MTFETLKLRQGRGRSVRGHCGPANEIFGPELVRDLVSLIQRAEADETVQVVVFRSADPDYFIPTST